MGAKGIKAIIVDDSMLFREVLSKMVAEDEEIEVVSTASDPYDARDKIIESRPNVMTLDVEMPKMDGIKFLRKLIPQYPVPTIVITSLPINAFEALEAGAVDFIKKPLIKGPDDLRAFSVELREKIKIARKARVMLPQKAQNTEGSFTSVTHTDIDIVAIGASTGGPESIQKVLEKLPEDMPPVVITQHMPPKFTEMFAQRLDKHSKLHVVEATDGLRLERGLAVVAAGEYQMRVEKDAKGYYVSSKPGEKVSGHCPSVDVLFTSVAQSAKNRSVAALLTGMGADGAQGLLKIKQAGGYTIGQDNRTSVVYGMPKVAFDIGAVTLQSPLEMIADCIYKRLIKE